MQNCQYVFLWTIKLTKHTQYSLQSTQLVLNCYKMVYESVNCNVCFCLFDVHYGSNNNSEMAFEVQCVGLLLIHVVILICVWHCCKAVIKSHSVFFVGIFCILNYIFRAKCFIVWFNSCVYLWLWQTRLIKWVHQCALFLIKYITYTAVFRQQFKSCKIWFWSWHQHIKINNLIIIIRWTL